MEMERGMASQQLGHTNTHRPGGIRVKGVDRSPHRPACNHGHAVPLHTDAADAPGVGLEGVLHGTRAQRGVQQPYLAVPATQRQESDTALYAHSGRYDIV
jgi:hypothetical protein